MATKKYVSQKQRTVRVIVAALLAIVILSAAFITGGVLYSKHINSGASMRKQIAFESENYKVNNCMMTYFYFSDFYNTYNTYGTYFQYMGLDPHTSMQTQAYDEESSWFDYFVNNSANSVNGYLLYAEAALEAGFEVADLGDKIDQQIDALKATAENAKVDFEQYLLNVFGAGIKESDIRDALELQIFASEYYNKVEKDYSDSLTAEDFETYYVTNKNSLDKVDYRSYAIAADVAQDADEATKNAAYAEAKADAEALLAAATSKDAFINWVAANLTEANADLETPLTEDEIKAKAEAVTEAAAYTDGTDLSKWAYAADRKVGDVTLIDDGAGTYTVYMLEKTAYRVEDATRDVRHILLTADTYGSDAEAEAKANELLATYLAGDKTVDAYDAIAKEYNEDSSSLYENVKKGQMVAEFENWLFDEARVAGDTGVVKTEYGYHIMYYVGEGRAQWQNDAYEALLSNHITEVVTGWQEKYTVDVNSTAIYALPDVIPETAFQQTKDTTTAAPTEADDTAEA